MRGQRLYTFKAMMEDGKTFEVNFWSHSKKGSIENFCDGLCELERTHKINPKEIKSYEISYAQTSLNRG